MSTVSIIIPTLNESKYLPQLLDSLQHQTRVIDEIIVADAGSRDATVEIAKKAGVRVVNGGMPGVGRNAGARKAKGDILLFLDADVLPPRDFIQKTVKEFMQKKLTVAACLVKPIDNKLDDRIIMEAINVYMQIVSPFSPRAPGFCIFVKRAIHQRIHGFDESLVMCEDHDYAKRAKEHGKFGFLVSRKISVSMRRLEKEGIIQLAFKYIWTELFALSGKPVQSIPFAYEFGVFGEGDKTDATNMVNVQSIRHHVGRYVQPVLHFSSESMEKINKILETDISHISVRQIRETIPLINRNVMLSYLNTRVRMLSQSKPIQKNWKKLKTFSGKCVRILNTPL